MTPILSVFIFAAVVVCLALLLSRLLHPHRLLRFMPLLGALGIITALLMAAGCSRSESKTRHVAPVSKEYDAVALAAQAKGEVTVIGTVASVGSFEWGTAPLTTLAAASLKHIPQMLHDQALTPDEAQSMINSAVKVRDLLKKANSTCNQNGATGKCRGNDAAAMAFADQARAEIVRGCLNLNDQEILTCLHR